MRFKDRELLDKFDHFFKPEASFGRELCKFGLVDAIWGSQVERRKWSLRYLQEGRLRLVTDIYHGYLHGEFFVFYPDGKLWVKGAYRDGRLVESSMKIFMPDDTLLQSTPDNVIPFPRKFQHCPS